MRAIVADQPGGPDVLRPTTLPDPVPGFGQVRIAVEVAAITFIDTQIRSGTSVGPQVEFPAVLGNGVAGHVDALGEDVDPAWKNVLVVTSTGGTGGYADRAVAQESDLHRVPETLEAREAVALLADGRTAVGLHSAARIEHGEVVVVTAAAGGVGSLLVQLAAKAGAHVIALAGSTSKLEHARDLGADTVINYRGTGWDNSLERAASTGVDVVFDGVGGTTGDVLHPLVRRGGRYITHGAASGTWTSPDEQAATSRGITNIGLDAIGSTPSGLYGLVEEALALGSAKILRPTIGQTYPLVDTAQAHSDIAARTTIGKTLLIP
ncbi:NADPH2:quinone reductase [Actinopolyspora xinjiangensis]|uniref:NADPH2:quinone reductase n=1 Tax=Actinopolyspora xinjiangensis TaxID=405564 RepID=A0A1H0WC64_9ACTN|nr:zinc-binding dehydrogenase [Actinopolyspora xinjiangensis]SDP88131.1 NADPH2:quinone reductase [Actinopolyspora xinjiangensis]